MHALYMQHLHATGYTRHSGTTGAASCLLKSLAPNGRPCSCKAALHAVMGWLSSLACLLHIGRHVGRWPLFLKWSSSMSASLKGSAVHLWYGGSLLAGLWAFMLSEFAASTMISAINCQLRLQQAWRLTQRPCAASRFPEGFLRLLHHLHAIVPWDLISACFRAAVKAGIDSPMALCTLP